MRTTLAILAVTMSAAAAMPAHADCLRYDGRITVEGTLVRETFPGPPDFESVDRGDRAETGWYLDLSAALCMAPGQSPLTAAALNNVHRVQLVLDAEQYRHERHRLGQRVTVSGEPFSEHTGHHHAPLVLAAVEFR